MPDLLLAGVAFQRRESGLLASAGKFPCGTHIGYLKVDQVTESVQAGNG